jgi:ligand-binding sensor domain-containing protein
MPKNSFTLSCRYGEGFRLLSLPSINGSIANGMKSFIKLAICTVLLLSCKQNKKQEQRNISPQYVEVRGYVVPQDSVDKPDVVPMKNPKRLSAATLKTVLNKSNTPRAITPTVVPASPPDACTPGQKPYSLPKVVPTTGRKVPAGVPEIIPAQEASTKDRNHFNFSSFGRLQGLPSDQITALAEDNSGNLWIGSYAGVSKYDGKSFTTFSVMQGLISHGVGSIEKDEHGNLWIASISKGLSQYDGTSFTLITETEGLSHDRLWSMTLDSRGNVWIGTGAGGVDLYDGRNIRHFGKKEGFTDDLVAEIIEDKKGNMWFARYGGVSKYDGKSFFHFSHEQGLIDTNIVSILEDSSGKLWFGTQGAGVIIYDGKTFTNFPGDDETTSMLQDAHGDIWIATRNSGLMKYDGKHFVHFTEEGGLSDNHVYTLFQDKRGSIWVGTSGGLSKYNGRRFRHFTEKEGLSSTAISSIMEDSSGDLWIGTYEGGVNKFDGENFSHLSGSEAKDHNAVISMLEDSRGDLWFCHWLGVDKYDGKSFTYFDYRNGGEGPRGNAFDILEDRKGRIWFGTHSGGLSMYDGKSFTHYNKQHGLNSDLVMCMEEDRSGNLWIGTNGGGLSKFDGKNFTWFTTKEGLNDNVVYSLLEDKHGNLWIGTLSGGISRYDQNSFIHFTEKNGLSDNTVNSIIEDEEGNLWFGTEAGLSVLAKDKLAMFSKDTPDIAFFSSNLKPLFKNYLYEDGFSGFSVNSAMLQARDGTIWVGAGQNRLTAFHRTDAAVDTSAPHIQLTAITLYNENIDWQTLLSRKQAVEDSIFTLSNGVRVHDLRFHQVSKWYGIPLDLSLAYDNNYLTFQFVGITTESPRKVKYQYKLDGQDKNWSAITDRSEATYGNLPDGQYKFRVKAMNGDGFWSNEFAYDFTIRSPWWHTWWAYTLFGVAAIGIMYALFRYRLNRVRRAHRIEQKTSDLEMKALRAQMNPHFIFNSLNAINLFILENNRLQASEYLAKFSKLIRLMLNNSGVSFISLEQELEALRLYLELESLRLEQRFTYNITVEPGINTSVLKVPPSIIQPYAENSIWHGLMHKKEGGNLDIRLYRLDDRLMCKISDDGIGRKRSAELQSESSSKRKSMGMQISADRISILQPKNGNNEYVSVQDIVLPDGSSGGTQVILKLPVSND